MFSPADLIWSYSFIPDSGRDKSSIKMWAFPPASLIFWARASSLFLLLAVIITSDPLLANSSDNAYPMPVEAPVTRTFFPSYIEMTALP